jgi:hypothetical protein
MSLVFPEIETATEKLKMYKLAGTNQILAQLRQAGCKTLCSNPKTYSF